LNLPQVIQTQPWFRKAQGKTKFFLKFPSMLCLLRELNQHLALKSEIFERTELVTYKILGGPA